MIILATQHLKIAVVEEEVLVTLTSQVISLIFLRTFLEKVLEEEAEEIGEQITEDLI